MLINFLTVSPDFFVSPLNSSILSRAQKSAAVQFNVICLRDFADGKENGKKQVDDKPFGGGPGMVLKIEPIDRALSFLTEKNQKGHVILTSAQGEVFNQTHAQHFAAHHDILTIICGHYEGVDARVLTLIDQELSLGQFVLTGGEPAALTMTDAIVRLLPDVLGNADSLLEESHSAGHLGQLEYPQYTQPRSYNGLDVPEVLLSGNHAKIAAWREENRR